MFVAVTPPEPVLEDLEEYVVPRRGAAPFRWSVPEQWHVTLAFMDDVPERVYDGLVERLAVAAGRRHPVRATITGGGAFPNAGRAKVLWAGLETDVEELERLATGARNAAVKAGVEVDGQRFRPHVTLGRAGRPVEATRWVRLFDAYRGPAWTVDHVALVASHLGQGPRGRPRYDVVERFALGGTPSEG
jgi:2'-5' RNA ligase